MRRFFFSRSAPHLTLRGRTFKRALRGGRKTVANPPHRVRSVLNARATFVPSLRRRRRPAWPPRLLSRRAFTPWWRCRVGALARLAL